MSSLRLDDLNVRCDHEPTNKRTTLELDSTGVLVCRTCGWRVGDPPLLTRALDPRIHAERR